MRIANRPLTAQQIGRALCERRQVTPDTAAEATRKGDWAKILR
ncbi:hypothetical protein [Azospirillum agricola]|nr:hypothetical protein [Azospirillum agricola]